MTSTLGVSTRASETKTNASGSFTSSLKPMKIRPGVFYNEDDQPILKLNHLYETHLMLDKSKPHKRDPEFYKQKYLDYCRTLYEVKFIESKEREWRRQNPVIRQPKTPYEKLSTAFSRKLVEDYKKTRKHSKSFKKSSEEIQLEKDQRLENAKECYVNEDFQTAAKLFQECITKDGVDTAEVYNMLGESQWRAGDLASAIENLSTCLRMDPFMSSAFFVRGDCFVQMQEFEKGRAEFEKFLKIEHPTKTVLVSLGKCCSTLKDLPSAYNSFNRIIKEVDNQDPYIFFLRGDILHQMGQFEKAQEDFDELRRLEPNFCTQYEQSAVESENNGELEEALSIYDSLVKINPLNLNYLNHFSHLLFSTGRIQEALEGFTKCIDKKPDDLQLLADCYVSKGTILMENNELEKALFSLDLGVSDLPDEPSIYKVRGTCHMLLDNAKNAKEDFEMLVQIDTREEHVDGLIFKFLAEYFFSVEQNKELALKYFISSYNHKGFLRKTLLSEKEQSNRPKYGKYTTFLPCETRVQYASCLIWGQNEIDKNAPQTEPEEDPKKKPPIKNQKKPEKVQSLFDMATNVFIKPFDSFAEKEVPTILTKDESVMLKLYRHRNPVTTRVPSRGATRK